MIPPPIIPIFFFISPPRKDLSVLQPCRPSAPSAEAFDEHGHEIIEIGDDSNICLREDRSISIAVDSNDDTRITNSDDVLDGSRNADGETQFGFHLGSREAEPFSEPVPVRRDRPRATDLTVEERGQGPHHVEVFAIFDTTSDVNNCTCFLKPYPAGGLFVFC